MKDRGWEGEERLMPAAGVVVVRMEGAVERVGVVAAGVALRRLRLDRGVADAEPVVQARIQGGDDGLTLQNGAGVGQDDVAGEEMEAVADGPDVQVMDLADGGGGADGGD